MATEIRIGYIGGGSRYWARDLMKDLALSEGLGGHIALYDIDHPAAARNVRVGETLFGRPDVRSRFRVSAVKRLPDALRGADFVVISIEPGPTEMRYADLEIPARYGVLQPVGDTAGPGGILRALRAVPSYTGFAAQIMRHCPRAWVINYTNPMTLCTQALYAAEPRIKAFGCCHEVFGTQHRLARFAAEWFRAPRPDRREIAVSVTGLNHFTWVTAARWRGRDLMPRLARRARDEAIYADQTAAARQLRRKERWFSSSGLIAMDLMRRFGALGAAGDRHLAEFVPWYLGSEKELHRWGVILTPYSYRLARARLRDAAPSSYGQSVLNPTGEEGVLQMKALLGLGDLFTNVNLPNRGQMAEAPAGHVVETNARFSRDACVPAVAGALPDGAAALVRRAADAQALTLQAALRRDAATAFQALLNDPLVTIPTDRAARMFAEMLRHAAPMLKGWRLRF